MYSKEFPDALARAGMHDPVAADFVLEPYRLSIDELFQYMRQIAQAFNFCFSESKQEEDFDMEYYEAANRVKKKKKKAAEADVAELLELDLPMHDAYESQDVQDIV